MRKVKCLVRGGCQFGGWNQVTTVALCDTLFVRFSNMAMNQATVIPPFPVTIGLRVVYITRYVIRIKKHFHNGIESQGI